MNQNCLPEAVDVALPKNPRFVIAAAPKLLQLVEVLAEPTVIVGVSRISTGKVTPQWAEFV